MRDRLAEALRASTADYAEIRFETEDTNHISFRGPEAESVSSSRARGGIVRACVRGGWGIAAFDAVDGLEDQVREACRCAALVGRETTQMAPVEAPADIEASAALVKDFRGVSLDDKSDLVARYNEILLKSAPRIESSYIAYSDSFRTVHFASTDGRTFMEERPKVTLAFGSVARDGALVQQAFDGRSSATTYDVVLGLDGVMEEVAARASALLSAPPCDGGVYTVVLDNRLAGVFAHEAFGHLSEADFLYENPKMRDLMHLGRRMGVPELNIVDDGSMGRLIGTNRVDDEGTPTARTDLIRGGVLVGHLHSRETAAKMGEQPTGNARAIRRNVPPMVRMTNTFIEAGEETVDDIIGGVDRGIYACRAHGGQTMMEMFTFSAAYAFRIENGQVGELVRDVVLTGNVFDTLDRIDGFANDFVICEGAGGCGKGGQFPLPVTFGSPHIRIRDVVVGGK